MIKLGVKNCSRGGKLLPAFVFTLFYSYLLPQRGRQVERRAKSTTLPSCLWQDTVSRGRDRAAPLPTHLLRICAGALKCPEQWGISKLASGQSPTSSRQGGLGCGALRLPHDIIRLPLLFPQNSPRDFCGSPERQKSAFSPLTQGRPTLQGSQKRFCEAKDFLGKGDAGVKRAAVAVRQSLA